jgi:hypothetical protein
MGLLDKFKKHTDKAKDLMESQGDKIAEGVDKATDVVDDKTGGKYADHLDKVDDMADKLGDDESADETAGES